MGNVRYNLADLAKFDALSAVNNFSSHQEYFDRLTDFIEKWPAYLHTYNPTVVIYGEDVRKSFLAELEETRTTLKSLEMTRALAELDNLEDATLNNNVKELSDGLLKFYAALEIAAGNLSSARLSAETIHENVKTVQQQIPRKPVVFAVDDKPEILTAILNALKSEYKVVVKTSTDAVGTFAAHAPDLFLLGIEMPGMNGYELAKKIREHDKYKNTPILFLTDNVSRETLVTALSNGGNDYVLKPVDDYILLNKVDSHLGRIRNGGTGKK